MHEKETIASWRRMAERTAQDNSQLREQNLALQGALDVSEVSRKNYQDLYEHAPVGYLILSEEGLIIGANLTSVRLLAQPHSNIIGSSFAAFIDHSDSGRYADVVRQTFSSGTPATLDLKMKRGNSEAFHAQLDYVQVAFEDRPPVARITLIDITERKSAEAEIEHLAFYDHLTSLPNRRLLLDRLQHALLSCVRTHHYGAVFFMDLDGFKNLNDTHGHATGDLLLQAVSNRLLECVRDSDTVARLGGDEFVVMIEALHQDTTEAATQAKAIGEKVLSVFELPFDLGGQEYYAAASVGITLFKDDHESIRDLLTRADLALYRAKKEGRSAMRLFDPDMEATVKAQVLLDAELRRALHEDQLLLQYQAQVDHSGKITGAEALLRWQHPTPGLIGPEEIIPFAEEKGLIGLVGQWVLRAACVQLREWSSDPAAKDLTLAINVSAHEFSHPDFVNRVLKVIEEVGADPRRLVLELTETVMLGSMKDTHQKMGSLKAKGISFALDDFGIGYSSLSYLQSLPMDQLKIDRAFVSHVLTNPNDATIARSIIALGLSLGLAVIAEGVETTPQRDFLASLGCLAYQGYLFGRPGKANNLFGHQN